jgi:2'-5' RNA ligase
VPRCFLAVPVEEPALSAAADLLAGVRADFDHVRWARPEGIHLTVHFFGPLPEQRWDGVAAAVAPACAAAAPFELTLSRLGAFPQHGPPRVLWLGVGAGSEPLAGLVAACHAGLSAAGVEIEAREHAAHCTLGRPRSRWGAERRRAWDRRPAELPLFTARRAVLFESVAGPGGSTYVPRREIPLLGGGD